MAETSRAIVLEAPHRFSETRFPIPEIGDDEFLLRVEMVTVCGGDLIEYEGRNRKARYPLILGHEIVGRIERIGAAAAARHGVAPGTRVSVEPYISCDRCRYCRRGDYHFCIEDLVYGVTIPSDRPPHLWGAYAEYLYGAPGAHIHTIEDDVPAAAACLTSVLGNAVRWIRTRGNGRVGEPVLILGAGVQALATVIMANEAGLAPVIVLARENNPHKLELAAEYGADVVADLNEGPVEDQIRTALAGRSLELAVECTGAESMIGLGVELLDPVGRLVQVGTRGGKTAKVDIDGVVFKEIQLIGGLGQAGDTELAARVVNSRRYPIEKMVTHTFPLTKTEEAIGLFMEGGDDVIHVGLDPTS